jgi:hypothetical protein
MKVDFCVLNVGGMDWGDCPMKTLPRVGDEVQLPTQQCHGDLKVDSIKWYLNHWPISAVLFCVLYDDDGQEVTNVKRNDEAIEEAKKSRMGSVERCEDCGKRRKTTMWHVWRDGKFVRPFLCSECRRKEYEAYEGD